MALGNFSKFYYGYEITISNYKFDFDEGAGELTANLTLGVYTPTDLALELKTQLDAAGTKTYTVTFSRSARTFTVSANIGTFDILISTGTNAGLACYTQFGFFGAVDLVGLGTYLSSTSGRVYYPQFWLQDYVSAENWLEKTESSVNTSANGVVEVISFGDIRFTEFNILFATNLAMDNQVIKNNQNGVGALNDFLTFCIKRGPIEFMPDENSINQFYKMTLETTTASGKGTAYRLKEETGKNLPGIFQSEKLKWRINQ